MHPLANIIAETLWPTRCALCDRQGQLLCEACAHMLDFIDYWQACPVCGAPWGRIQCDHCATARILAQRGKTARLTNQLGPMPGTRDLASWRTLPQAAPEEESRLCLASLRYTEKTATLIKTFKDKGEQRLAPILAGFLIRTAPPSWRTWAECVTYITATKSARRRRGFDHMELVAREVANVWGLPCLRLLAEPRANDQRALGRLGRLSNMDDRFRVQRLPTAGRVIVIDDVFTTGSTMNDACAALESVGCSCRSLVVARV